MGLSNPSRETKCLGANGDWEEVIFPVQLTTSKIGNLTRLILTLAICDDHTCIHTPAKAAPVWNHLGVYWPCAGRLSAVDAIGTQLRDPIKSELIQWRMAA